MKNIKNTHKYIVCSIVFMLGLTAILSGCAAPNVVTKNIEEPKASTIPANNDAQIEKMEELIEQIVNQTVNGELSIDTLAELENMGIDSDMITAFKEIAVPTEDNALFNDGVYTGTGDAHNGDIVVEVTVHEGKILYIEPIEHSETAPKLEEVFKSIPLEVLIEQSAQDVDAVSGATEASNGYIEAIEEALSKAQR